MLNFNKKNVNLLSFTITIVIFICFNLIFSNFKIKKQNDFEQPKKENQSIFILNENLNPKNIINQNKKNQDSKNKNPKIKKEKNQNNKK